MSAGAGAATFSRPLAVLVAGAYFLDILDGTIVTTAAPAIGRDFGVGAADVGAAIACYLLAMALGVPLAGWIADRLGVRTVFVVAIVGFAVTSLACGLTTSLVALCICRVLQGASAACMFPVGQLAILRTTPKHDLLAAMAYLTWPGLIAPVVAPAIGGLVVDTVGWRWIFLADPVLCLVLVVAAVRIMPRLAGERLRRFDAIGLALFAVTAAALVIGLDQAQDVRVAIVCGAALLVGGTLLVLHLRRAAHPVLDFRPFRTRTFRVTNGPGALYRMLITAVPFLTTLLLQVGRGFSAAEAGLLVVAVFAGNLGVKPFTSPLIRRLGFRVVLAGAAGLGAVVLVAIGLIGATASPFVLAPLLLVSGALRSIGFSGYNTVQYADIEPDGIAAANTLAATVAQVATATGVAVVVLVVRVTGAVSAAVAPGDASAAYQAAFFVLALILLVPAVDAALLPRGTAAHTLRRPGSEQAA